MVKCFGKSSDTPDTNTCARCRQTLFDAHGIDRRGEAGVCQEKCAAEQLSEQTDAHFQEFLHDKTALEKKT